MAKIASCPIWGTRAEVQSGPDSVIVSSPRAGGKYQLTGSAEGTVRELAVDMKARLTWWLIEQRRQGETCPTITTYTLDRLHALPCDMPNVMATDDPKASQSKTPTSKGLPVGAAQTDSWSWRSSHSDFSIGSLNFSKRPIANEVARGGARATRKWPCRWFLAS